MARPKRGNPKRGNPKGGNPKRGNPKGGNPKGGNSQGVGPFGIQFPRGKRTPLVLGVQRGAEQKQRPPPKAMMGVKKSKAGTKPSSVQGMTVSPKFAKMIHAKLGAKLTGNKDTQLAIITNILEYVSIKQARNPSMSNPRLLSIQSRSLTIQMNNIESVYLFLVNIFCDQVHDSSSKTGYPKGLELMNKVLGLDISTGPIEAFDEYIEKIEWLNNDIKKEIKEFLRKDGEYKDLLEKSFFESKRKATGKPYYNMNETTYMYNSLKLQKQLEPDPKKETFVYTSSIPTGYSGFPNTRPMISFDQTSKAAGPSAAWAATVNKLNSAANPLYVISLPVISDLGSTQPSNPIITFYENMKECIDIVQKNPGLLESALASGKLTSIDKLIAGRYIVLNNDEFKSTIMYNDKIVLETKFSIDESYGTVNVNITKPSGGAISGRVISGSNMTKQTLISNWIFKTIGDLNILLISIASQSAALTGDRTAGAFYMLFSFLKQMGLISVDNNKSIMFIFEGGGPTGIVVTTNFRTSTNTRESYINYLERAKNKVRVNRQNIPGIPASAANLNRHLNHRNGPIEKLFTNRETTPNREKVIRTKKLLTTGNAFRRFVALVNSNNVVKKAQIRTAIKGLPNRANIQPSSQAESKFYSILASVAIEPNENMSNENMSNENMPNVNRKKFISTLAKELSQHDIEKYIVEQKASLINDNKINFYTNILRGTEISRDFANKFKSVTNLNELNNLLINTAIRNSINKLYRNVPQMGSLRNNDKLSKFNQWLRLPDNTPYLRKFVIIKNIPDVTVLKMDIVSAINLLGHDEMINALVFRIIQRLLEF